MKNKNHISPAFSGPMRFLFITPTILVLVLIIVGPLVYTLYLSFHEYLVVYGLGDFWGFTNYADVWSDDLLHVSIVTAKLTFWTVSIEFLLAFGLALLLHQSDIKFKNVYLIILTIPILMTPVAVALGFRLMFNPELGIINYLIGLVGIEKQGWFGDPNLAMQSLIFVDVWHETSLMLLLLYAGLTALPNEPREAAMLDGHGPLTILWHVTIPLMKPVILVTLLIRMIAALKSYDLIYMLTAGGPGNMTETISYHAYRLGFRYLDIGQSSAVSFVLLVMVLLVTLMLMRSMKSS